MSCYGTKHIAVIKDEDIYTSAKERKVGKKKCFQVSGRIPYDKEPSAWRYNWANLFLGDMNMGTWPSRLGKSQMRQ
jgi:hypothetical protein